MTRRLADFGSLESFSGISANDRGRPFVTIRVLDDAGTPVAVGQTDPETTRTLALALLATAEAAESDAAVYAFLTTDVAVDEERAAVMIGALRTHREKWDER